jgi:hypothetical protein
MHWSWKYVGKPWVKGARGPNAYDCFGLFLDAYKAVDGVELPDLGELSKIAENRIIRDSAASDEWKRIDLPEQELDAICMGRNDVIHHIGIWTEADGGRVIHSVEGSGVISQTLAQIMGAGYRTIQFYRHA